MNIKDFKSGTLRQEYQYKSFLPEFINHTFTWDDPQINTMLEDATRALGELNAFTMIVPNVDMFIPPHHNVVAELMGDLEKFLHNEEIFVPHLIKIAIAHYQFETIHPFLDGNGRIGRLLITLYLVSNRLLKKPSLYLSDFIEKHKSAYYEALTRVRTDNDLIHWIKFFLEAVIVTANSGVKTFQDILSLKQEMDTIIVGFGKKAHNASKLLEFLYQRPIISISDIIEPLEVSKQTASVLVKEFEEKGILIEITGYERNKLFAFDKYLSIYSQS